MASMPTDCKSHEEWFINIFSTLYRVPGIEMINGTDIWGSILTLKSRAQFNNGGLLKTLNQNPNLLKKVLQNNELPKE